MSQHAGVRHRGLISPVVVFGERGGPLQPGRVTDLKTHIASIPLRGCEVIPGLDSKHPLTFRLLRNGQEVAVLEVGTSCPFY